MMTVNAVHSPSSSILQRFKVNKGRMVQIDCAICSSLDTEILCRKTIVVSRSPFRLHTQTFYLSICRTCGFVFQNPRMTKGAYDEYYSDQFDKDRRPEVFANMISDNGKRKLRQMIKRIKPHIDQNGQLNCLDVGAGPGTTLEFIRNEFGENRKLSLFAIEPSISCRSHLQDMDVTILSRYVEGEWEKPAPKFDIIIMRHVLEHFYDPLAVLQKISSILKESGILYVAVPDLLCSKPRFFKVHMVPGHMSYFSHSTFARTVVQSGLELCTMESGSGEIWSVLRSKKEERPKIQSHFENQYGVNRSWIKEQLKKEALAVATFTCVQGFKGVAKMVMRRNES